MTKLKTNHGSREPDSRKIITVKKYFFSNGELFTEKFLTLNSYLSIPILINSKDNIETTGIPIKFWRKGAVFLLDSEL
jgi:mevalonate kinase